MPSRLEGVAFRDEPQAERILRGILDEGRPELAEHLRKALGEAAEPCRVLVRLEHFLEAGGDRDQQIALMASTLKYTRLLCTILDHSQFLTDIVCRYPEYMTWLWVEGQIDPTWSRADLTGELRRMLAGRADLAAVRDAMRRFQRREILRIGARDVFLHASIREITADLSNLADAALQGAFEAAERELDARYGRPRHDDGTEAVFAILGMGKLGGRELNFSSDIDLIFIYSDEGETTRGYSNHEYFVKLSELIIKLLTENTSEGHVFRVDMRLRPHGRMAPLATSLATALDYFETLGQPWERQALIKARPAAGDLELGRKFIERTRPFVYPRYFDDATLEEIREIKRQLEARVAERARTETEVKLGRGGIRDVEFTVQMLQLLNGGKIEALRTPNTLEAIAALGAHGILSPFEALTLDRNYQFMRQVEHRLQIEGSQQRHDLPREPAALDDFARRMGYQSGPAFMTVYRDRAEETRRILERFFATEGAGNLWISELLNPASDASDVLPRLTELGFHEPERSRRELLALCTGPEDRPYSAHVRQRFREVAPTLLEALSNTPDPDRTLMQLGRVLANVKAPSSLYDLLKQHPALGDALVRLASNSQFLTDLIIRDPGLFETFGYRGALDAGPDHAMLEHEYELLRDAYDARAALYRLKNAQTLRTGLRELLLDIDVVAVGRELTLLAEFITGAVLEDVRAQTAERRGASSIPFAVLGLGKLGGREMGYGSDLDLVFVYGDEGAVESGAAPVEYFADVASALLKALKEPTQYGMLYDIDARLRPDGQKGVLAVSRQRFEQYYREEAQAWERLALVKGRFIAGDQRFGEGIEELGRELCFDRELTAADLEHIEDIRRRIIAQASELDLKKGEGGLSELEFAVRILQIRHAAVGPALRRGDVLGALEALEGGTFIGADDAASLRGAYILYRRIENRIRMWEGRPGSRLPEDAGQRTELASRLGIQGDVLGLINEHKRKVHAVYAKVLDASLSGAR